MRIGAPGISSDGGRYILAAPVTFESVDIETPEFLEFSLPEGGSMLNGDLADAFLTGLLPAAMKLGEDIHVDAPVSMRLAHGLSTYQRILNTWWPESFRRVEIHYHSLNVRSNDPRPAGVGCTFSGGLDSWHTVAESTPANMPYTAYNVTHALLINGFDQVADLDHDGMAQRMFELYQPALAQWDIELLMIDTNLKHFRQPVISRLESIHSYGSMLASAAHALGNLFGRFSISGHAAYSYAELKPKGSHAVLDHHLGTDQLQVIYAGTSASRAHKLEMLVDVPMVQRSLRVCFHPPEFDPETGRVINCGECEKCVRTIASLLILGKLEAFESFKGHRPVSDYQRPEILSCIQDMYLKDMSALAQKHGREEWVYLLERARQIRHNARTRQAAQTA